MKNGNYDLVLYVIESFDDEDILSDFKNEFEEGKDIKKDDFISFCEKYSDDCGEWYYIKLNWEWIKSGGDYSVYNNEII